ncbi:DUF1861 family protein [Paenibacillus qinlingensis]|uniref:DUF1861 family protein n=1 Tax=Paenibacillus qinlingensis TaxID=1837343 RepID=A0ABU1NNS5_9BACL|nr:DUF1861 family protein [Paenibacillus qinlingensis]MDR6549125.1 hypothetical protein [Paenibacillus qinlingensis]
MAHSIGNEVKSSKQLLETFNSQPYHAEKLVFANVGNRDVYNIAAPFIDESEMVLAGRVEARDSERSEVMFFVNRGGTWIPREGCVSFALQDPFFTFISGELVFGGVEVAFDTENPKKVLTWRTLFYRGADIQSLTYFACGPDHMKDIRLVELASGRIGVFTRPLGVGDARGLIGYTEIEGLEQLNESVIDAATLFTDQFRKDEWGGVNEAHVLKNGLVGVLGHIAYMEEGDIRHYHAMTFAIDPTTLERSPMKIIATRNQFPDGPAKRNDLMDVIFSGGLHRLRDGKAMLYAGVSDTEAHKMLMDDPFEEYENR